MKPLLLSGFGISLRVDKRRLIVENKLKGETTIFHPHQMDYDSIVVDGHTGMVTFEAVRWLMKHDVNLTLLNWNGELLGTVLPKGPKSGRLKIRQYQAYLDGTTRLQIARQIVRTKIIHSINLLSELSKYYSEINSASINNILEKEGKSLLEKENEFPELNNEFNNSGKLNFGQLNNNKNNQARNERQNRENTGKSISRNKGNSQIEYSQKYSEKEIKLLLNKLMNFEGRIATIYWDNLSRIFRKIYPEFNFVNRKNKSYSWNMNASDEINALLNYGYSILESEIRKIVNTVGLDSTIGYLHEIDASKTPLIYDLQELFRWMIDLSVIQLLEEKKLRKSDFIVTENYHIRLKENTAKMLLEKISLNFNKKVDYGGRNASYQTILFYVVQQLANYLLGKEKEPRFEASLMKIDRNDHLVLREKISDMSPDERKALRINKSTLWYQKRNLASGKRIKIYAKVLAKMS